MNTKGQDMEIYQISLVPMGNNKITEELELQGPKDSVTPNNKIEKARDYLDDKESPKYSVSTIDKIGKIQRRI